MVQYCRWRAPWDREKEVKAMGIWSVQAAILNRGGKGSWGPHWEEDI